MTGIERPLPRAWDGRPVQWQEPWREAGRVFICDRSRRKNGLIVPTCSACGSPRPPLHTMGLLYPIAGDVVEGEYVRRHRTGRPLHALEEAPPTWALHAQRCQDCGHDTVYDFRTGEVWDLDESDYGPDGSVAP
jgi:hypothetical protein